MNNKKLDPIVMPDMFFDQFVTELPATPNSLRNAFTGVRLNDARQSVHVV